MRDLFKILIVGVVLFFAPCVFAENYKVLILPDNIVTENAAIDSFIYNATAEFFADEISTLLNNTDYIKSPSVSEARVQLKNNPATMIAAKNLISRFRTSYNVDYVTLNKIAKNTGSRYVLLLTSYIDSENYVLRRSVGDFLNIPGVSVIDPAYKISTYAVLADTEKKQKLWADTYYKTISTVEGRIMTRGASPQVQQLEKIKDYSRYICPQIAQNVQRNVLPADLYAKESSKIDYDMGNIDNIFTKKYRHIGKESDKFCKQKKEQYDEFSEKVKKEYNEIKADLKEKNAERKRAKLEVKAQPIYEKEDSALKKINTSVNEKANVLKNAVFTKKQVEKPAQSTQSIKTINYYSEQNSWTEPVEIKKSKRNNLYQQTDSDRPLLRNYYN